jgi:hypothetical protein
VCKRGAGGRHWVPAVVLGGCLGSAGQADVRQQARCPPLGGPGVQLVVRLRSFSQLPPARPVRELAGLGGAGATHLPNAFKSPSQVVAMGRSGYTAAPNAPVCHNAASEPMRSPTERSRATSSCRGESPVDAAEVDAALAPSGPRRAAWRSRSMRARPAAGRCSVCGDFEIIGQRWHPDRTRWRIPTLLPCPA